MYSFRAFVLFIGCFFMLFGCKKPSNDDSDEKITRPEILSYVAHPSEGELKLFLKDEAGSFISTFEKLKARVEAEEQELLFAMNGGMFHKGLAPVGLYVQEGKVISPLDTLEKGYGNFYLQPNGVFHISGAGEAGISRTDEIELSHLKYATQSGPMLLIDGELHPEFRKNSSNLNIRNGVGILPDGSVLFALSKAEINFYDFATFFQERGCKWALYLDGVISRAYLPAQEWEQMDGEFGVLIAQVTEK